MPILFSLAVSFGHSGKIVLKQGENGHQDKGSSHFCI
jgi:hypothetical protein